MESQIAKAIKKFGKVLEELKPEIPIIASSPSMPFAQINNEEYLIFCSNNYLGLANSDIAKKAAIKAIEKYGFGSAGSRWASGTTLIHRELEKSIAIFKRKEEAVIFSAGFMVNAGSIPALTGSLIDDKPFSKNQSAIFSDELNHASIIDGCNGSQAAVYVYKHKDMNQLSDLLKKSKEKFKLIVTDGVFSMNGDIAPLDNLVELANQHEAMVMVDEAHSVGILGKTGRGAAEHFGVEDRIDIAMGTFSKTFGSLGGYIVCNRDLAEHIRCLARTYIFSASMPACNAAVVIAILSTISKNNRFRKKVLANSKYFREKVQELGFDTLDSQSAIIPILIGREEKTIQLARELLKNRIYATCAVWPAVEKNQARLRATVTANHTFEQIDYFIKILKKILKKY